MLPIATAEMEGPASKPVSVIFPLDEPSGLIAHLRSLPRGGRVAQTRRNETLRAFAALGLADQSRLMEEAQPPAAGSIESARHFDDDGAVKAVDPIRQPEDDFNHLPMGLFFDQVIKA